VLAGVLATGTCRASEPYKAPPNGTKLIWSCTEGPEVQTWTIDRDQSGNVAVDFGSNIALYNKYNVYSGELFLPGMELIEYSNIYQTIIYGKKSPNTEPPDSVIGVSAIKSMREMVKSLAPGSYQFNVAKAGNNDLNQAFTIRPKEKVYSKYFNRIIEVIPINLYYLNVNKRNSITWFYYPELSVIVSRKYWRVKSTGLKIYSCEIQDIEATDLAFVAKIKNLKELRLSDASAGSKSRVQERVKLEARQQKTPPTFISPRHIELLRKKHRHAIGIIIGNKQYKGRTPEVSFAHNDADAIKDYLLNWQGYREGNIIDLRDASQAELMAVFGNRVSHEGKLFNYVRAGKSDVTVFYSGHGVPGQKDKRGYLLPVDADPNLIEINGFPIDVLFRNLALVPAKSMSVFLDACFSGDSPRGMIIRATSGLSVTPKMPANTGQMVVLTAAQGDQYASWDEDAKQGLFTKHLLAALKGAADKEGFGNGDGEVSLAEVQKYLDDEMTYQARRRYGRRQRASVQGDPETVLARN
jgi:hypothetical protein